MGKIASGSTTYAVAYLTEKGRSYLFGKNAAGQPNRFENGVDNFQITQFTLFDNDTNYQATELLEEGDIPDVAGTSDTVLKTAPNQEPRMIIARDGEIYTFAVTYVATPQTITINSSTL